MEGRLVWSDNTLLLHRTTVARESDVTMLEVVSLLIATHLRHSR